MQKTLGILITSQHHGAHLEAIVRAASRKRIKVRVHISGTGVRLCLRRSFHAVLAHAEATICHHSAERLGIRGQIETLAPNLLTSPQRQALNINQCSRCLVL